MEYSKDIKGLLKSNEAIADLWINEDATEWHTYEVIGMTKISREEVLGYGEVVDFESFENPLSPEMTVTAPIEVVETKNTIVKNGTK